MDLLSKKYDVSKSIPAMRKNEIIERHPVETIQKMKLFADEEEKMKLFAKSYGTALPMQLTIERNNMAQIKRMPGEKSSLLSLRVSMNRMNDIDWEDVMGNYDPNLPKDLSIHTQWLERQFN